MSVGFGSDLVSGRRPSLSRELPREALQVGAGFAEANSEEAHPSNLELLSDEVVQRRIAGDDIPSGGARGNRDFVVAGHRIDGLGFDERNLPSGARPVRIRPAGLEVAIPLEPLPGDRADPIHGTHRSFRPVRDVNGSDLARPSRCARHDGAKEPSDIIVLYSWTIASASISTTMSGSIRRAT